MGILPFHPAPSIVCTVRWGISSIFPRVSPVMEKWDWKNDSGRFLRPVGEFVVSRTYPAGAEDVEGGYAAEGLAEYHPASSGRRTPRAACLARL